MAPVSNDLDLAALIADTEAEILRLVGDRDPSTVGVYEMVRYHLGLDGTGSPAGKRMRPLLGLLAYASIAGDYHPALPGAAAVELGHNFSLVHDDIEDGDRERRHRPTVWALHGIPQAINTGDMLFSLSRMALHRLTDLGFSDARVLRLMRLYDETCVALCEGQYIDIATSESAKPLSVELYFDMIGRKTAALIAGSIEAGAILATDDEAIIRRYRGFGWALGIAFQLNDDLLGIWGQERATGKEPTDLLRQEDAAGDLRVRARGAGGSRAPRCALRPARADRRCRLRDHGDPRSDWRARVHAGPGPTLPGRGPGRARRGGRHRRGRPRAPRGDHRLGDQRLSSRPPVAARRTRRAGHPSLEEPLRPRPTRRAWDPSTQRSWGPAQPMLDPLCGSASRQLCSARSPGFLGLVDREQRLVGRERLADRDAGEYLGHQGGGRADITVSALAMMKTSAPVMSYSSARRTACAPSRASM